MRDDYKRYAIYYAPAADDPLWAFGNAWLGRNPETGDDLVRPAVPGLDMAAVSGWTMSPARYGFHGTIKPPFVLADGKSAAELDDRLSAFAADQQVIEIAPLRLKSISRFLVFALGEGYEQVGRLASDCVQHFDDFRAPPSDDELARRRMARLSPRQEELLAAWGYPYVMDEFRFHLTLTDRLEADVLHKVESALAVHCQDLLSRPFRFRELCLYGDPGNGAAFQLLKRYPLGR